MQTTAPDQVRARVLQACKELFFAHGVRAVTMDDVAQRLGMSKKTIYQYFTRKEEIIRLLAQEYIAEEKLVFTRIVSEGDNALDGIYKLTLYDMLRTQELNPLIPQEVCRYFPQTWQIFLDYSNGFLLDLIQRNLELGIQEGLYRTDIDVDALARINAATWQSLTNATLFPPDKYPLTRLQNEYTLLYLHGIVTPRGAQLLQQYIQATPIPH